MGVFVVGGGPILNPEKVGLVVDQIMGKMMGSSMRFRGLILYISAPGTSDVIFGYRNKNKTTVCELQAILCKSSLLVGLPKIIILELSGSGPPDAGLRDKGQERLTARIKREVRAIPDVHLSFDVPETPSPCADVLVARSVLPHYPGLTIWGISLYTSVLVLVLRDALLKEREIRWLDILKRTQFVVAAREHKFVQMPQISHTLRRDPRSTNYAFGSDVVSPAVTGTMEGLVFTEEACDYPPIGSGTLVMVVAISKSGGDSGATSEEPPLLGAIEDGKAVTKAFERLGCTVFKGGPLVDVDNVLARLKTVLMRHFFSPGRFSSFVLYVSGRGSGGSLVNGAGGVEFVGTLKNTLVSFGPLAGFPKLLILDIPGGEHRDIGVYPGEVQRTICPGEPAGVVSMHGDVKPSTLGGRVVPTFADIVEVCSVVPGYIALGGEGGSYFTNALVRAIEEATSKPERQGDMLDLLESVCGWVSRHQTFESRTNSKGVTEYAMRMQQPFIRHTLRSNLPWRAV
jgi:hypothetical protein